MPKKTLINRWKEHHQYLEKQSKPRETSKATEMKEEIMKRNGWSNTTFYRKMENPANLSPSEKITVAFVYDMPAHFLFPEMEPETV